MTEANKATDNAQSHDREAVMAAPLDTEARGSEAHAALSYKFTRPDGVRVTTILEGGKAHIMEESERTIRLLERGQFTPAEGALLNEAMSTA